MDSEKKILYAIQILVLVFAFGYLAAVTFFNMPGPGAEHSKTIVGFLLGTVVGTILQYNWGSSKGSKDKTDALEKRAEK